MKIHKCLGTMALVCVLPLGVKAQGKANPETETFDLKFPGGSPSELLAAIESAGGKVNALVSPEMEKIRFPKLDFRSVTTANVLTAVSMLDNGRTARWISSDRVWVLTTANMNRKTQVFYIGDLLNQFKVDDITTAIQTTWDMGGKAVHPEMKFHEETKLLIVLGEVQQLDSVSEVLGQLAHSIPAPSGSASSAKSTKATAPTTH